MAISQDVLDALWDFSDPAASEARLREAVKTETDAATRCELETQVARALGLQDRFTDADAVLDAIDSSDAVVRTRVALERGRVRNSSGDAAAAITLFVEATDAAAAGSSADEGDPSRSFAHLDFLLVDALHMLAIADSENSAHWTEMALQRLDGVTDARTLRWRVGLHNNRGWALFDAGDVPGAIAEFEKAKDAASRWGTPQQVEWADEALAEARASLDAYGR